MARKPDIQYIQFYTDGNAAKQMQTKPRVTMKYALSKAKRPQPKVIYVDPLALGGMIVSAVMLILMIVGSVQLFALQEQTRQMESYVSYLYNENYHLKAAYEAGYDLEEIEKTAHVLGLVPVEEKTVTVSMPVEKVTMQEPTMWQRMSAFFQSLFA